MGFREEGEWDSGDRVYIVKDEERERYLRAEEGRDRRADIDGRSSQGLDREFV